MPEPTQKEATGSLLDLARDMRPGAVWSQAPPEPLPLPAVQTAEQLIAKAIDAQVPIETMERLLAMRDRLKAEQAKEQFFAALAAFQGECPVIPKTKKATIQTRTGGTFTYSYAPLDVIVTHTAPLLQKHDLCVTFDTRTENGTLLSICTVHHRAGHSETTEFRVPIDKEARMNDVQKVAAAATYAKRQNYQNALGILSGDEDNDGQGTQPKGEPVSPQYIEQIRELAVAKGSDVARICEHYCVETLDDLTAVQAQEVIQTLKARRVPA